MIIRNNVTYGANSAGMTVGGYAKTGTGGSTNISIVNNSLYNDDLQDTGSGEFQIQYRATGIVFENNIVYPGSKGLFLFGYVSGSGVTLDHNDYYTTSSTTTFELNGTKYSSFASYQSATGQDEDSKFREPPVRLFARVLGDRYDPIGRLQLRDSLELHDRRESRHSHQLAGRQHWQRNPWHALWQRL